jgi:hypothetical protein
MTLAAPEASRSWSPTAEDKAVAWDLFTEIRTRITVESLHYRMGDEETALESVYKLFGFARESIRKQGAGSRLAAGVSIALLNTHVRPFTARWHKAKVDKRLAIEDERHKFRTELRDVQTYLIRLMNLLGEMTEGADYVRIPEPPPPPPAPVHAKQPGADFLIDRDVQIYDATGAARPLMPRIYEAEEADIARRRATRQGTRPQLPDGRVGLALSGGGVRSSTFSLGVIQSFARHGLMQDVDYLSTVSGGGYVGSFISSYFNSDSTREPSWAELGGDSKPIRFLRDNAAYLGSESPLEKLGTVCFLIYGIIINALPLLACLLLLVALTYFEPLRSLTRNIFTGTGWALPTPLWQGLIAAAAVMLLVYPVLQRRKMIEEIRIVETLAAVMVAVVGVGLFVELSARIARVYVAGTGGRTWASIAIGVPLAGTLGAIVTRVVSSGLATRLLAVLAKRRSLVLSVVFVLVGLVGIGLPMGLYLFFANSLVLKTVHVGERVIDANIVFAAAALLGLYVSLFLNVNRTSPHVLYRGRLCRTFLLRADDSPKRISRWKRLNLSRLMREGKAVSSNDAVAPYHLICAASNVQHSKTKSLQGRGADFFLFSKHFCGSPSTGYCGTAALEEADGHLDLGTAMAISGAAASSLMGGISPKQASWALTLLNVRLGYWLPNPSKLAHQLQGFRSLFAGAGPAYLFKEHTSRANESAPYVNVSDGGHLENLGVYELLRRRCKLIIALDGEADPVVRCGSLMRLLRFAEVDLDVRIDLDLSDIHITDDGLSRAHFNVGRIHYPTTGGSNSDGTGLLVYVKASRTGDEPPPVVDYQLKNPLFPHQSTADQFFDEAQFESYRLLGNHIGEQMFRRELLPGGYQSVADWKARLESNLLVP